MRSDFLFWDFDFKTTCADSLDTVELIMEFEEEFGIEIPDEDAEKITNVSSAVKYVEEHK